MRVLTCSFRILRGVNFILIRPDGKVLVQKRTGNAPTNGGMFCFPGGGIEEGENPLCAAIREMYEETDVVDCGLSPLCDIEYPLRGEVQFNRVYIGRMPDMREVQSLEGEMYWKTTDELGRIPLALGENILVPFIKEVINGSL